LISQFKQTSSKAGAVHCIEFPQYQGISCLERDTSLTDAPSQNQYRNERKKTLEAAVKSCIQLQLLAYRRSIEAVSQHLCFWPVTRHVWCKMAGISSTGKPHPSCSAWLKK
jgi:hypothetical protein